MHEQVAQVTDPDVQWPGFAGGAYGPDSACASIDYSAWGGAGLVSLVAFGKQTGVATDCGGVYGYCALGCEALQVMGPTGFGTGSGQTLAAEGLHTDGSPDDVPVDIGVSNPYALLYVAHGLVDTAVNTQGKTVTRLVD